MTVLRPQMSLCLLGEANRNIFLEGLCHCRVAPGDVTVAFSLLVMFNMKMAFFNGAIK